jgi:hypothetical protein
LSKIVTGPIDEILPSAFIGRTHRRTAPKVREADTLGRVEGASGLRRFPVEEYFRRDQLDRLLLLFEDEFGDEAGISRTEFLQWREDEGLCRGLEGILSEVLAGLIAARLPAVRARHA